MVGLSNKDWSDKLDDALSELIERPTKHRLSTTPFKLVYDKPCHLPIELEHKAHGQSRQLILRWTKEEKSGKSPIDELDELRQGTYENAKMYKEKMKSWHDKHILRREFKSVILR